MQHVAHSMHTLSGQPAFAGLESTATTVPGLIVSERVGVAIASVLARKGRTQELANRVRAQFGIELPVGPRMTRAPGLAFVGIGVAAWLALSDTADVPSALQAELGECASLSDHSSALALLRLTGAKVRATLAKLLPLDLHDRAFGILNAASSVAAHVSTRIWR